MIKRLQLRNFRTHKKLDIRFGSRVNSIIGNNYAGKSTILRAIWYASQNKPSGDSIIRWGASKTSVRITDDNNNKVKRIKRLKGKVKNLYKLNDKEFKAFGNKVPDEIQKTLGLSAINFQGQHDAPYWFSKTAGEVSRELNIIVNLDIIDSTLSTILSGIQATKTLTTMTETRRDNFKEEKNGLKYVKDMNTALKLIESLSKQKDENAVALTRVAKLVESGISHAYIREIAKAQLSGANLAVETGNRRRQISKKVKSLSMLIFEVNNLNKTLTLSIPSSDVVDNMYSELEAVRVLRITIEEIINDLIIKWEIICQQKRKYQTAEARLKKEMGKICPLCETKL